ncbi:MAG TPA: sigma-54 dependent transcriptional regulator [Terriglobales bacterium]|nr:sigma-54 dependent transcriptional regulator [Terriglobales bacterium]
MIQNHKILSISKSSEFHQEIKKILPDFEVSTAQDSTKGLKKLKEEPSDIVILDSRIEDYPCENLVKKIANKNPRADLLLASEETPELGEIFLGCGADDLLQLPLEPEEVRTKVKKLLKEKEFLESCGLVGKSEELKKIAESILQVAPTNITVSITGESGTGKELVARAIHNNSPRKAGPFVAANCGALAEGVLESELFGHERGAFTGAISKREGFFERADKGTIFLDEIAEIKPAIQVKLLRILEEKTFLRVGGVKDVKVDVRVIAATNKDLEYEVELGNFRSDLYFRLSVVKIDIPPLRKRTRDIPILVYDFIQKLNQESSKKILGVTEEAMELLLKYHWPGNVRELRNFLESSLVFSADRFIEAQDVLRYIDKQVQIERHLPVITGKSVTAAEHELIYQALLGLRKEISALRKELVEEKSSELKKESKSAEVKPQVSIDEMEKELIDKTLKMVGGNRKKAAKILGIGERTLYRKIDQYGLREP